MDVERARATIATERPRPLRMEELLRECSAHAVPPGVVSLASLCDRAAEAGFGFLVGALTLVAIPFVGLSTPFGLAIALLGFQLALGRRTPWLPGRARRRELTVAMIDRVLALLHKRGGWVARLTRPRWEPLIRPRLVGLGVAFLALGLALPLPIPGSNLVFLVPLFVYAMGLLERDGAWILVGHALALVDAALLVIFGRVVWAVLARFF
ncbi:MAG TPA: exopolysaccharide biosynthesis protein [Kofleriaceae bacterium]|jgi:hypothetical protein